MLESSARNIFYDVWNSNFPTIFIHNRNKRISPSTPHPTPEIFTVCLNRNLPNEAAAYNFYPGLLIIQY